VFCCFRGEQLTDELCHECVTRTDLSEECSS
jgi:hypothetical protein